MQSRCHGNVEPRGLWQKLGPIFYVLPGSISRHCVKRDVSTESAYACTAAVWKFRKAVWLHSVCHRGTAEIGIIILKENWRVHGDQ